MDKRIQSEAQRFTKAIRNSGLSIYDHIAVGHPVLWIPAPELEALLNAALRGMQLSGLPLRTRSKVVKQRVCEALGYPVPKSFRKGRPRFPGQMFDTYVQKSNNLQIWNEELSATRRYVLIRVSATGLVERVKVVTGDTLALLDTTGTLTKKYQARCVPGEHPTELVVDSDTAVLAPLVTSRADLSSAIPIDHPTKGEVLDIKTVFRLLSQLVGRNFGDAGFDQERNRAATLHRLACAALGYGSFQDDGRFPDMRHQLLELKLQTSPTIDLGLVRPTSIEPLDVPMIQRTQIRHCDVRYAIFYGIIANGVVTVTHLFLTTGEAFFNRFPQFQGKVLNEKLQIPLPADFFET